MNKIILIAASVILILGGIWFFQAFSPTDLYAENTFGALPGEDSTIFLKDNGQDSIPYVTVSGTTGLRIQGIDSSKGSVQDIALFPDGEIAYDQISQGNVFSICKATLHGAFAESKCRDVDSALYGLPIWLSTANNKVIFVGNKPTDSNCPESYILDTESGQVKPFLPAVDPRCSDKAFPLADGRIAVTAFTKDNSASGLVYINSDGTLGGYSPDAFEIASLPGSTSMAVYTFADSLELANWKTGDIKKVNFTGSDGVNELSISPDGKNASVYVYSTSNPSDSGIWVVNLETSQKLQINHETDSDVLANAQWIDNSTLIATRIWTDDQGGQHSQDVKITAP